MAEQERPPEEEQPSGAGPPSAEDSLGEAPPPEEPGPPPTPPEEAPAAPEPPAEPVPEGVAAAEAVTPPTAPVAPPPVMAAPVRQNLVFAAIAGGVVLFGTLMFLAGFAVHALVDEDGTTVLAPSTAATGQAQPEPAPRAPTPPDVDDDPVRGPDDAPVVVIEFSDFQCPYCGRFFRETLPQIEQNYGDRIQFVYRDFPLSQIHPYAQKSAEAAQCAYEQDAFWDYHDLLFTNQDALDDASLKGYAQQLGLNSEDFAQCLDSGRYTQEVSDDYEDGLAAGVDGTPTFFINGQQITGAQPYAVFQSAIESALADANE